MILSTKIVTKWLVTGGAVPALAQLVSSSYHSLTSSSEDDKAQDSRSSSSL